MNEMLRPYRSLFPFQEASADEIQNAEDSRSEREAKDYTKQGIVRKDVMEKQHEKNNTAKDHKQEAGYKEPPFDCFTVAGRIFHLFGFFRPAVTDIHSIHISFQYVSAGQQRSARLHQFTGRHRKSTGRSGKDTGGYFAPGGVWRGV